MNALYIAEHAYKHGLAEEDILHAWVNHIETRHRIAPHDGEVVVIGPDRQGRLMEIIAKERMRGIVIYHAKRPPTPSILRELNTKRRC